MKLNVVLFQPEIPQNTGNIMRTCVGVDAKLHLIKPLGFSLDEKHLRRSAVDYYQYINYEVYENLEDFFNKNPDIDIYLMFGCESSGLPYDLLANHLDTCFRLPTTDRIRSLNLSNCVAVALFEVLRQLDYEGLSFEEPENLKGADFLDQFKTL